MLIFGTLLGLLGAWGAGRAMQTLLFGVPALHPTTFAAAVAVMTVVTIAACVLPALRAAKVDPLIALHGD